MDIYEYDSSPSVCLTTAWVINTIMPCHIKDP